MKPCAIPSCYFPSTVIFVDDSRDFLINFTLQLDDQLAYQIYNSPFEALDALSKGHSKTDEINQRCVSEYLESYTWPGKKQTLDLDLSAIHSEVYNPNRFSETTVVVVDYAMPGMNGLEFCERLENSPIQKILLTGQADEETAINAFNKGLIDRFIRKSDDKVTQKINESIAQLQQHYFQNMSEFIHKMLTVHSPSCLEEEKFVRFFKHICEENHIVEFYLTENTGSFLLLDADANPANLIVKNASDVQMYYELAADNKAPAALLEQIRRGEKMPYFWQASDYQSDWTDWLACVVDAHRLECKETYFYALVKDHASLSIARDKILSYREYLDRLDISGTHSSSAAS